MKPYGPLMQEHRLIERFIKLLWEESRRIEENYDINGDWIEKAVDFFRYYVDKIHHGKEEDILFRALAAKKLSEEERYMMERLVDEHERGRELVGELAEAKKKFEENDVDHIFVKEILDEIDTMYRHHINIEDKHFFIPMMAHLTPEEQEQMSKEMEEFDRKHDKDKYEVLIKDLEEEL